MARDFNGSSDSAASGAGTTLVTGVACTISGWFNSDSASTNQTAVTISEASGGGTNSFQLGMNTTGNVVAITRTTTSAIATSSTAYSTGTWNHGCAVFTSSTSRAAFLNGGGKGTDATSKVPASLSRYLLGVRNDGTLRYDGRLAEVAIWDAALDDAEVAALARGVSPLEIRPGNLVAYWPLNGRNSPEIETVNRAELTLTGTALADHVAVFYPKRRQTIAKATAAAAPQDFLLGIDDAADQCVAMQAQEEAEHFISEGQVVAPLADDTQDAPLSTQDDFAQSVDDPAQTDWNDWSWAQAPPNDEAVDPLQSALSDEETFPDLDDYGDARWLTPDDVQDANAASLSNEDVFEDVNEYDGLALAPLSDDATDANAASLSNEDVYEDPNDYDGQGLAPPIDDVQDAPLSALCDEEVFSDLDDYGSTLDPLVPDPPVDGPPQFDEPQAFDDDFDYAPQSDALADEAFDALLSSDSNEDVFEDLADYGATVDGNVDNAVDFYGSDSNEEVYDDLGDYGFSQDPLSADLILDGPAQFDDAQIDEDTTDYGDAQAPLSDNAVDALLASDSNEDVFDDLADYGWTQDASQDNATDFLGGESNEEVFEDLADYGASQDPLSADLVEPPPAAGELEPEADEFDYAFAQDAVVASAQDALLGSVDDGAEIATPTYVDENDYSVNHDPLGDFVPATGEPSGTWRAPTRAKWVAPIVARVWRATKRASWVAPLAQRVWKAINREGWRR